MSLETRIDDDWKAAMKAGEHDGLAQAKMAPPAMKIMHEARRQAATQRCAGSTPRFCWRKIIPST